MILAHVAGTYLMIAGILVLNGLDFELSAFDHQPVMVVLGPLASWITLIEAGQRVPSHPFESLSVCSIYGVGFVSTLYLVWVRPEARRRKLSPWRWFASGASRMLVDIEGPLVRVGTNATRCIATFHGLSAVKQARIVGWLAIYVMSVGGLALWSATFCSSYDIADWSVSAVRYRISLQDGGLNEYGYNTSGHWPGTIAGPTQVGHYIPLFPVWWIPAAMIGARRLSRQKWFLSANDTGRWLFATAAGVSFLIWSMVVLSRAGSWFISLGPSVDVVSDILSLLEYSLLRLPDTLSAILWVLPTCWIIGCLARFWADGREQRSNHCGVCDYDLTGNTSGVCPECGTAVVERTYIAASA